jgi:hypothetical protein
MYNEDQILKQEEMFIDKSIRNLWKYLYGGRWLIKCELVEFLTFQEWCNLFLLGIHTKDDVPKCPICGNARSFDAQHRRYRVSCGNPSCAQIIALQDPELRDRISNSVRENYIKHPELKDQISESVRRYFSENPEAGKLHSEAIKTMWADENSIYNSPEYRAYLGECISKGLVRAHANPDSGYNDPEVIKKRSQTMSKTMSRLVREHPESFHARNGQWMDSCSKCINSDRIYTRSTWEFHWIEKLESDPKVISYEWESLTLEYIINGEIRYYVPDALVHYVDHDELQEVKRDDWLNIPSVMAKTKAALLWCNDHNIEFRFICYEDIFLDHRSEIDYSSYLK